MKRNRRSRPPLQARSAFAGFRLPPDVILLEVSGTCGTPVRTVTLRSSSPSAASTCIGPWTSMPRSSTCRSPSTGIYLRHEGRATSFGEAIRLLVISMTATLGELAHQLVVAAHAGGHSVVSPETAGAGRAKVNIPDACAAFDVACVRTSDMLRDQNVRLVPG